MLLLGFPGGSDGKEPACNAEDPGSIPVQGVLVPEGGEAGGREERPQRPDAACPQAQLRCQESDMA